MNSDFLLQVAMPISFILMAGFNLFIGLKTLKGRRPLVFSSRWLFAMICLGFLPNIANSMSMGFSSSGGLSILAWMSPLMLTLLLGFFWIQMKGYTVVAISDASFREALLASASSLGFTIQETMSRLRIQETGQEMQVSVQGWTGVAQLKAASKEAEVVVEQIAHGMTRYFERAPGKMNFLTAYLYFIVGVFLIAMAVSLFTLKLD
jgi:hypothetical protein